MNTYQLSVIYRKKIFIRVLIYFIITLLLIFLTIYEFKYQILQLLCLVLFILPLILIKKIISFYTYKIEIIISSESLSFIINKSVGTVNESTIIQFSEIEEYKILFVNKRFADLIIYRNGNKKNNYSFLREKMGENEIDGDGLLNKIQDAIVNYNNQIAGKKIELLPSFYASNSGLFCILFFIVLFCIAIILHFIYSVKSLPFSLFLGAALLFQLILRRKADIKFYAENK